jgi:hypothetical protein
MTPPQNPEVGRELLAHELKVDKVVWITRQDRHTVVTVWVAAVGPVLVEFVAAAKEPVIHFLAAREADGTLTDDTGKRIHVYEYLGKV